MTKRVTKAQRNLLGWIRSSGALHVEHTMQGPVFRILNGPMVDPRTALCLIRDGLIIPQGDTLFGRSQTYKAAADKLQAAGAT